MFFLDNHDYFLYTCHITNYSVCMYDKMTDSTFLVSIIAQYLFNKDEDKLYFDLIKELKAYHGSKKISSKKPNFLLWLFSY